MERRKALATAGAVSVTALALVVALGANVGLFGLTRHDDGPGRFKLVGSTQSHAPNVRTEIVDVPVPPAPSASGGSSSDRSSSPSAPSGSVVPPAATSAPSATSSSGAQPTSDDHEAERPESDDEDD